MAKVLIVGAGAAGLMAAGAAVRQGHQVTVLEHMDKPGQKILVTGKGRCNVTNDCPAEEFLRHVRTNPRFLYSSLGAFPPAKTMELFEGLGVELKVERGRRVFPVSDKAEEIRQALLRYAQDADIVYDGAKKLLLEPLVVELSAEEKTALLSNLELLESAGLEIDDFGGNSVFLRSVPADVEQGSAEDLLVELADKLSKGSRDALSEKTEWVLHSISCRAAIKAGDKTSPQELMALAEKILSGEVPPFCPHGRPCVLKLTRKELEKQFGRIV